MARTDAILQLLVKLTEGLTGEGRIGITLAMNGMLVSGEICQRREFMASNDLSATIVDALKAEPAPEGGTLYTDWDPEIATETIEYMHLKNARYWTGIQPAPTHGSGIFIRCHLSDVSAFNFGTLGPGGLQTQKLGS